MPNGLTGIPIARLYRFSAYGYIVGDPTSVGPRIPETSTTMTLGNPAEPDVAAPHRARAGSVAGQPRIAIAGMAIESSSFSPHRAGERDFHRLAGDDLVFRYDALRSGELIDRADWIGVYYARAIPGGAVLPEVYDSIKLRICAGLADLVADGRGIDGLFFDIHGAMSVVGLDDAEGDLITAIRAVIGPDVVVSASMDLHGNVTRTLVENVDLITCYRLAPHEDAMETKDRALRNLVEALASGRTPHRAWVRIPILLPGEKTSTRVEPAKSLYARIEEVERRPGIVDAAIWVGYAWADEPRCHATVVVTGHDEAASRAAAEELGRAFWDARTDFEFVGPPGTLDEGIAAGLAASETPYLVSDSGDNPGAGGTGDVTWTLCELLAKPELTADDAPVTLCASVFDADAIATLRRHAVGDRVSLTVGARVDAGPSGPVHLEGVLHGLHEGDPDAGTIAVIRVGGLHAIVTEHRKAFHGKSDFEAIGLDPAAARIIVTKIGYLEPELYAIQRGWTLALTPGGVDQDLGRLGHHRIRRPMFPFDAFGHDPDLSASVVESPRRAAFSQVASARNTASRTTAEPRVAPGGPSVPVRQAPDLELIALDLDAIRVAAEIGARRVELCQGLALGGLTASPGLLHEAVGLAHELGVEVHALIRPRAGGFHFSADEITIMCADVRAAVAAGADGVRVGLLGADGFLDLDAIARLQDAAAGTIVSLHRAIDVTPDPLEALDRVLPLGLAHVLTSGGARTADAGRTTLARMVQHAAGATEIMAGGGVSPANAAAIAATGVHAVHFSAKRTITTQDTVNMGSADTGGTTAYEVVDPALARAIAATLAGGAL